MMLNLCRPKTVLLTLVGIIAIFAGFNGITIANAAPPDEDCHLSEIPCDLRINPSTHDNIKCALCDGEGAAVLKGQLEDQSPYTLSLTPNAEILYPLGGETFYVDNLLGYAEIPLRGRANNGTRMLSGKELSWFISDGVRITYAWAEGESTSAKVYHSGETCLDLIAVLHGVVQHWIYAYDYVNITVCPSIETS